MRVVVSITDFSKPRRAKLAQVLKQPGAIAQAAAQGALPVYQRQMLANSRTNRNRFGARSTFWARMNAGTRAGLSGATGFVAMPREMRLRVFGGVVRPVNGSRFLTIPLRREAYGKSLRQFERVFFIRKGGRLFALAYDLAVAKTTQRDKAGNRKLKDAGGYGARYTLLFKLLASVRIKGNAALLPADALVESSAMRAVKRLF